MKVLLMVVILYFSVSSLFCDDTSSIITNPEVNMNVTEIITYYGYPVEAHEVTTEDNYILSLQRIPYGKTGKTDDKKPVAFLQHGLLDSSFSWVINGPQNSLAFILVDAGYDVWLGNSRGNVYSRKHKFLSSDSNLFWDFTWDEMAKYDLPACVSYVLQVSGAQKLSYIGHSQGTEIAFAKLGENGPLNAQISSFVAMAPVAFLGNVNDPASGLAILADFFNFGLQLLNHGEFMPNFDLVNNLMKFFCSNAQDKVACSNIYFMATGIDTTNLDKTRVPIYLAHVPAGTSSKNMVHYAQSLRSKKFQMYDYGLIGNWQHYNNIQPPQYSLGIQGVPIALFYGARDKCATPEDVDIDSQALGTAVALKKRIETYSHIDFIWATDARSVIYNDLIAFIRSNQ